MSGALTIPLAWLLLAFFGALARLRHRRPTRALLLWAVRTASRAPSRANAARRTALVAAFEAAYRRRPFEVPCLPRSLALHRLLSLHGLPARVRLGLAGAPHALEGHAWVECGGAPIGESETMLARFRPCETS